jgi:hypothetical protein
MNKIDMNMDMGKEEQQAYLVILTRHNNVVQARLSIGYCCYRTDDFSLGLKLLWALTWKFSLYIASYRIIECLIYYLSDISFMCRCQYLSHFEIVLTLPADLRQ